MGVPVDEWSTRVSCVGIAQPLAAHRGASERGAQGRLEARRVTGLYERPTRAARKTGQGAALQHAEAKTNDMDAQQAAPRSQCPSESAGVGTAVLFAVGHQYDHPSTAAGAERCGRDLD
jgi:hypothetical protein